MAVSFAGQAAVGLELVDSREAQIELGRMTDRERIAADLHDHVIQELFAVGMGLQGLIGHSTTPYQVQRIGGYVEAVDTIISRIRSTIFELQLDRSAPLGLKAQILDIASEHTDQLGYSPSIRFAGPLDLAVEAALASDILAVVREAMSNCARHAHATRLDISVTLANRMLIVELSDDGRGIGTPTRSSGLANLRHRAESHHGTLTLATPDHGGTRLTWTATTAA
jgi:signal transduction histidine kinase